VYFRLISSSEALGTGRMVLEHLACIHTHVWCGNLLKDGDVEPIFYDGQIKDDTMNSTCQLCNFDSETSWKSDQAKE
jgi:hypothetical protein